jgi:hypothetical protein
VARAVNAELVVLYWETGSRIRRDILGDARAEYGNQIVSTLPRQLTAMAPASAAKTFPHDPIRQGASREQAQISVLAQHLGWSHFKEILYLENELARQFYAEMCRLDRWSVRTLRDRVRSMMFERTSVSRLCALNRQGLTIKKGWTVSLAVNIDITGEKTRASRRENSLATFQPYGVMK